MPQKIYKVVVGNGRVAAGATPVATAIRTNLPFRGSTRTWMRCPGAQNRRPREIQNPCLKIMQKSSSFFDLALEVDKQGQGQKQ